MIRCGAPRRDPTEVRKPLRAAHPIARLLWFDQQLRAGRYPTARAYAEHFAVTPRTAYRDVEYFRETLKLPIGYDPKRRGYCYREPHVPPLPIIRVTAGELIAVYIARQVLARYEGSRFGALLAGAFEKIAALLADEVSIDLAALRDGFSFHVDPPEEHEVEVVAAVSRALAERKELVIEYRTQPQGEVVRSVVDPYRLHDRAGVWYLIGYCHRSRTVRAVPLAGVEAAVVQERTFERSAAVELEASLVGGQAAVRGGRRELVSVRFDPARAASVAARTWHGTARCEPHPDGSLTLHFELTRLDGLKRWVLSHAPHAEVLAPAWLRREVSEEARRTARVHRTGGI